MTFRMDGSGEMQVSKDAAKEPVGEVSNKRIEEGLDDTHRFVRERNMLLLSALYNLYGEDWSVSPDWYKVAEEIESANIPNFGEAFTAESCEHQYKLLMEDGYQIGMLNITRTVSTPKRLTEAEKRLYVLAATSNDLVSTSRVIDEKVRTIYKQELAQIDSLHGGTGRGDYRELDASSDGDNDEGLKEILNYDDPSTQELAVEVPQYELNENIAGLQDVLLLVKYCNDAVAHAMTKFLALHASIRRPQVKSIQSSPVKPEKGADLKKNTISANQVSEELGSLVHSAIANASEDGKSKVLSPTSTAPTLSKLLEMPATTPGKPLPEIASVKQLDLTSTPEKVSPKCTPQEIKEATVPDVKDESASTSDSLPTGNGEEVNTASNVSPVKSTLADTNGQGLDSDSDVNASEKLPEKTEETAVIDNTSCNNNKSASEKEPETATVSSASNCDVTKAAPTNNTGDVDGLSNEDSEATTVSESSEGNEAPQQESPTKGKQSGRKNIFAARPIPTRTSSRLASPEPIEKACEDVSSPKKPPSRQSSTSEVHTPTLRSRRGATPTKVTVNETEAPVGNPASKLDFTEENEDETFETPRSTPESTDTKSDIESVHESKPPQQLKVYSAKPPSTLSHVDPKIFDDFIDEEDDPELTMIDSSVNKSKSDKSTSKTYTTRGRTASTDNASEVGNNEDSAQPKRVTKKGGVPEDVDEEGTMNNDEGASKRLTRSSLKQHDAANEESTDAPQTGSEKAPSESSFSGKEKKPRPSKSMVRLKNLQDESMRVYGDVEETPEGKRLTRARAKTSAPQQPEKRSKPPSVADSEGLSESEPASTRATRSRSSTVPNMPVLEPTTSQQVSVPSDDEEQKSFRKNALSFVDKISSSDCGSQLQKYFQEDPSKVLKRSLDFSTIKKKIETAKLRTLKGVYSDLISLAVFAVMAHPTTSQASEAATSYQAFVKVTLDEFKNQRNQPSQKNDNSDVESLESHDETSAKQTGGRRKRKRSVSETSEEVLPPENKRRVTRTSTSNSSQQSIRKPKHPISPDIVSANRVRN